MNEKRERKSVFFALSLLAHFLLITLLLSMPAKMRNSGNADYSRRVIIDFDIPAPKKQGDGKTVASKEASPSKLSEKPVSSQKEIAVSPHKVSPASNQRTQEKEVMPVEFSFNARGGSEVFGIDNLSFPGKGGFSQAGFGKGSAPGGFGEGEGSGFSGRGSGNGKYYTDYYDVCLRKIEAQKKYPATAVIRQIEGEAQVKITLLPDGTVSGAEIIESSGWDMLDREAVECVRRASPFPAPPEEILRDSKLVLSFTIFFELS